MIKKINISGVRSIKKAALDPEEKINIISGDNGSGKTSVLEAISILSGMRHFKSGKITDSINYSMQYLQVTAKALSMSQTSYIPIGILSKSACKSPEIKINGCSSNFVSSLTTIVPAQKITSNTFQLLESSSKFRRGLLDWGMFHVKHSSFFPLWKQLQKAVYQRNMALKKIVSSKQSSELFPWDFLIAKISAQIDSLRSNYFNEFLPVFYEIMKVLDSKCNIKLEYFCGWDKEIDLMNVLKISLAKDIAHGYTGFGAHKADIVFKIKNLSGEKKASCVLSRGEMKLVACAFKIAQAVFFNRKTSRRCIFLLDDLPAELDKKNIEKIIRALIASDNQLFLTSINSKDITRNLVNSAKYRVFNAENGNIQLADGSNT